MYGKLVSVFLLILLATGCSTLKPVEMTPQQLQQRISAGELISVGDTVKIATSKGEVHNFEVTDITDEQIRGDDIDIPIDEVVAVETREFSAGKTAALAGGTVAGWAILVAIALGGTLAL